MKNSTQAARGFARRCRLLFMLIFAAATVPGFSQIGWVQVPSFSPGSSQNTIRGISGTSSSDVWAVGYFSDNTYPVPEVFKDLLLHWNGTSWQQFPPLNLSTSMNDIWDIEAVSSTNVWAVGSYQDVTSKSLLFHYNGTSWTNNPLPSITGGSFLRAIHAVSPTDIWAAGGKAGPTSAFPPYVIRYNGSSWTEINVPNPEYRSHFNDIHGSANDIWAVGFKGVNSGDFHSFAMHWDGSGWSESSLPASVVTPQTQIFSVKSISANDVWAVGAFFAGGMFTIHWDGTTWSVTSAVSGAPVIDADLAAVSATNIFGFAKDITRWSGSSWTVEDPLTQHTDPILRSTVIFSNGEVWAGGHAIDIAANKYVTLIYRSVNHTPVFNGGTTQSWNVTTNSNNNSPGNLLLTNDPDVSQILTYSIITSPAHGSLTGLPTTAITNNGTALPAGVVYTPFPGYTGTDQFRIRVSAGTINSETTINVNVSGVLPVTLTGLTATQSGNSVVINWKVATEYNMNKYEIERSTDGRSFIKIGEVAATNMSGSLQYQFTDVQPFANNNFYRLRMVDMDGTKKASAIVKVTLGTVLASVNVFPNPVTNGIINIQMQHMPAGQYTARLLNTAGQVVMSRQIIHTGGSATEVVYLSAVVTRGLYHLEVSNETRRNSLKLIIQ